jgi:hypothetical protein
VDDVDIVGVEVQVGDEVGFGGLGRGDEAVGFGQGDGDETAI